MGISVHNSFSYQERTLENLSLSERSFESISCDVDSRRVYIKRWFDRELYMPDLVNYIKVKESLPWRSESRKKYYLDELRVVLSKMRNYQLSLLKNEDKLTSDLDQLTLAC